MATPKQIAVIGTGISGMAAAWLLSQRHQVTVYERDRRVGGHSNTVTVAGQGGEHAHVDTGFIVYNELTYPNLTALFRHLDVPTQESDMSFAASLDGGAFEYSGGTLSGLVGQKRNLWRPRFWSMLRDVQRFYRRAPHDLPLLSDNTSLGQYLDARGFGGPFRNDHLLPVAGAIWSCPPAEILQYPAASFIRFQLNHGLLKLTGRPVWRTVTGGSQSYVKRLTRAWAGSIRTGLGVTSLRRHAGGVTVRDTSGTISTFSHVVIATHADQALALLEDPSPDERDLLGAFRYSSNRAVLHSDRDLMPRRRAVWSSWNYIAGKEKSASALPTVTYWMNALQRLPGRPDYFVTLNPRTEPRRVLHTEIYDHPVFDGRANAAQRRLWSLQGKNRTWFCGSYFGAGFHEDGLQAGLAVAEALGGMRRPWQVADESGRIHLPDAPQTVESPELAA